MNYSNFGYPSGSTPDKIFHGARLAYSTGVFSDRGLDQALGIMAFRGVKNYEIWADTTHLDPRNEKEDLHRASRCLLETGARVVSIHAPFSLSEEMPVERQLVDWEILACQCIARADYLGAGLVVLHPMTDSLCRNNPSYTLISRHTWNAVYRLADIAAVLDVRIALENMPSPDGTRFGGDMEELYRFVTDSGQDNLGLCLDTGHSIVNGEDPLRNLRLFGDRIFTMHIHDNLRGQPHDLHLVPGQGDIDWPGFKNILEEIEYHGNIVIELDGKDDPEGIFEQGVAFARRFFSDTRKVSTGGKIVALNGHSRVSVP